ncbi:hypothetical protein [Pseudomonas batumici]|uniref:Putative secreted protein n=1 Tax=Pseudomonas batumici TaxID=226910 RepID=A0A0C2EUA6_9PSED|nr:hypothetical protein [Pseudomonas batumici]KIH82243.1 putative secreted protein [Pseudomonas batumici]
MLIKTVSAWLLTLSLASATLSACAASTLPPEQIKPEGLSREQAQQVLVVALKQQPYKLSKPGVFIDGDLADGNGNPPHPGYFDFSLGYDDPKAGATEYWGLFSVSVLTGDVWEINSCKRLTAPALKQLQTQIMARTGKTLNDEAGQRQGLGCEDDK